MKTIDKKNIQYLIRIFLAIVFVLAVGYRIINPNSGHTEMIKLGLPEKLKFFVISLELIITFCIISGYYIKKALLVCIGFLTLSVFWGIYTNFHYIINNIGELFIFDANPTDIVLHFMYIFICIILLFLLGDFNYNKKPHTSEYEDFS